MVDVKEDSRWCVCSQPPGSTHPHCRVCCSTFTSMNLFDGHRVEGNCWDVEGVYEEDGIYSTEEGHSHRKEVNSRLEKARAARGGD